MNHDLLPYESDSTSNVVSSTTKSTLHFFLEKICHWRCYTRENLNKLPMGTCNQKGANFSHVRGFSQAQTASTFTGSQDLPSLNITEHKELPSLIRTNTLRTSCVQFRPTIHDLAGTKEKQSPRKGQTYDMLSYLD